MAGTVFHVLNRAARSVRLFEDPRDYAAFLRVLGAAQRRVPLRLLAYCVMPTHFHLVAWPQADDELSRFMQWLTATHCKRWHACRGTNGSGPLYQGRFRAFPVQTNEHFLNVCRYVERNAVRARIVSTAEEWQWSSFAQRRENRTDVGLHAWPVPEPANWRALVNATESSRVLAHLRQSVRVSAPYGSPTWCEDLGGHPRGPSAEMERPRG
jgi:putative transposase